MKDEIHMAGNRTKKEKTELCRCSFEFLVHTPQAHALERRVVDVSEGTTGLREEWFPPKRVYRTRVRSAPKVSVL
jgi:hypothetical protein